MGTVDPGWLAEPVANMERVLAALRMGRVILLIDNRHSDAAGWLAMAADSATADAVAFIARHTSGVIQAPIASTRFDALRLPVSTSVATERAGHGWSVGVAWRGNRTTLHSPQALSETLRALANGGVAADGFGGPGHVFPVRAVDGGVIATGQVAEAASDLSRLAGRSPAAVLAPLMTQGAASADVAGLRSFAQSHGLPIIAVSEVVRQRFRIERLVEPVADAVIPTRHGDFLMRTYRSSVDDGEHVALTLGEGLSGRELLVRVHSECLTGDVFGSVRCDCGAQLDLAMARIAAAGRGVIVYLRGHEGRGIGLSQKLRAYRLQDAGRDTVQANEDLGMPVDARDYGYAAQVLKHLRVGPVSLLSNNPAKAEALRRLGIGVERMIPHVIAPTPHSEAYLAAKRDRLGHVLPAFRTP